jgi:hypothetical protein
MMPNLNGSILLHFFVLLITTGIRNETHIEETGGEAIKCIEMRVGKSWI